MNYYLITLEDDEYYCPGSICGEKPNLSTQILNLTNGGYCVLFKNTYIIRSEQDLNYWVSKIAELKTNTTKGFLVIEIDIAKYKTYISGHLTPSKWNWLREESSINLDGKLIDGTSSKGNL